MCSRRPREVVAQDRVRLGCGAAARAATAGEPIAVNRVETQIACVEPAQDCRFALCGSTPSLNRQRGHCQVPWTHRISAPQRQHDST